MLVRYGSDTDQILVKYGSNTDQILVEYGPNTGQIRVKYGSNTGRILVRSTAPPDARGAVFGRDAAGPMRIYCCWSILVK